MTRHLKGALQRFISAAAALTLSAAVTGSAYAQSSVELLVNDQPVTSYDIDQRMKLAKLTSRDGVSRQKIVDSLIEDALKRQETELRNVSVSEDKIDEAYASIAQRANLKPSQLSEALQRAGIAPRTLRDRIRTDLEWGEVVRARFRATVRISEQDIAQQLSKQGDSGSRAIQEYDLQRIIFVLPAKAGRSAVANRRREADAFRRRFKGCDDLTGQVKALRDVAIKRTGRRDETSLPQNLRDSVKATPVGKVTPPITTENGIEVIAVCGKRAVAGKTEASVQVQGELAQERGQLLARRYLRDLRSDAVIEYK